MGIMLNSIRLAMIKIVPHKGCLSENHAALLEILAALRPQRPDVIITPECFLDGYVVTEPDISADSLRSYAVVPDQSPYVSSLQAFARENRCWMIYGLTRLAPEGAYNSAVVIDRAGAVAGIYDKTHIQTHDVKFARGQALPVFPSDFGPFGVMICADRRWPETVRTLALKGARILFNPTYGMHDERNLHMMQTRSYESEVVIAFAHPSQSLVTGPQGEIIANNQADAERWTLAEVDLAEVDRVRSSPAAHLRDRRADLYG
jgi:predicted amidohydrolase